MINYPTIKIALRIFCVIAMFFVAIQLLATSLNVIGHNASSAINLATENPFIGLFIGLLATAILQSSSTITSLAVAAVAAGSITLQNAVPIVIGANIGTTLTSTIVSLGYITKATEFKKAISAGTTHDLFNIIIAVLIFPLEYYYNLLTKVSVAVAGVFHGITSQIGGPKPWLHGSWGNLLVWVVNHIGAYLALVLAVILLFVSVKSISRILYKHLIGRAKTNFQTLMFRDGARSFGSGLLLTSVIQSSSITTSLIVPLVATGKVQLRRAFQFILGANLGTTITAIFATLFESKAAISLAMAHFLFNFIGVFIFLLIPALNRLPTYLSDRLGDLTLRSRIIGFTYILLTFFLLPFSLIYFSSDDKLEVQDTAVPTKQLTQEKTPGKSYFFGSDSGESTNLVSQENRNEACR